VGQVRNCGCDRRSSFYICIKGTLQLTCVGSLIASLFAYI
jgi:hypothetical protein